MLRPTRSRLVTKIDIVPALRRCNLIKIKSFRAQFVGISAFASWTATVNELSLGASPRLRAKPDFLKKIAGHWRCFSRSSRQAPELPWNEA
jgi:hypothetical protein